MVGNQKKKGSKLGSGTGLVLEPDLLVRDEVPEMFLKNGYNGYTKKIRCGSLFLQHLQYLVCFVFVAFFLWLELPKRSTL